MASSPSTANAKQWLDQARERRAQRQGGKDEQLLNSLEFAVKRCEKLLALAEERDRLTVELGRPDGCWCLGVGGKETAYVDLAEAQPVETFREYCPCPDGEAEKTRVVKLKQESNQRWWVRHTGKIWEQCGIPKRFQGLRLETAPILLARPKLREAIIYPEYPSRAEEDAELGNAWDARVNDWERSWFIFGPNGTGKTGLAVGYAAQWLGPGYADNNYCSNLELLFRATPDLFTEFRDTYRRDKDAEKPSEGELLARYSDIGLLVLDDIGAEHVRDTGWLEDRLYQIVNRRHGEERTTIFTSNLNLDKLAKKIGERITWRIVEMCGEDHIIDTAGAANLRDRA